MPSFRSNARHRDFRYVDQELSHSSNRSLKRTSSRSNSFKSDFTPRRESIKVRPSLQPELVKLQESPESEYEQEDEYYEDDDEYDYNTESVNLGVQYC